MLKIRNGRDFVGGVTMICVGLPFLWFGRELEVGDSFRMGPGYFPTMLSLILLAIGAMIIVQSLMVDAEDSEPDVWNWKAYSLVIAAPVGFGLLLSGLGLAPTIVLLIAGVGAASRYANWRHSILLGLFLAVCSVLVFTKLLSLPVSAFGPWVPFIGDLT
ncbi:tripartite tricarboxylate transporter TctB family protein [Rhizobium skierniewicense]|uniref:tripartite tricarboxylate transporter TctB family protein n=1 Tax=Rhizobium TaxID=379 RepID=UPI0017853D40|nr:MULTISPECIES: tripartite tricarboxylate transporter TctB family protein [Rhizobium]MBD8688826.1 tripartite tricarboxylate transporter TctB family protein [Rhizobium sp. CFBP 13644]MBD8694398.1 tripartite tricarboxylate transporter TctB family protein [Rhizobium sp. CFBP 13717]MCI9868763.1 tripartite tricarboxylate transporter TctB family protein [Rhizobium skierniewicense]